MEKALDSLVNAKRVVSPHAIIGFLNGAAWVHCGDTNQIYSSTDAEMVRLLAAFSQPADVEAVMASLGQSTSTQHHLLELTRVGALLPVDGSDQQNGEEPAPEETRDEPVPGDLVQSHIAPLAMSLDSLASTLAAIGPEIGESIRRDTGVGLKPRLMACMAAFLALRKELDRRIPDWVQSQLRRLALPSRGLSVHLGAGSDAVDGWVNIDVWPSQMSLDLRWGLPFADQSVDRVYLSHTLEHLYYPHEVGRLLRDICRVLAPEGRVRIVVPDIELAIKAYVDNDRRFFEGRHETAWPEWNIGSRLESFLGYAGVGPHPGMFGHAHKYGYDFETLASVLKSAGFRAPKRCSYQGSDDPMLRIDDASSYAGAQVDGRYYSLFVEATC